MKRAFTIALLFFASAAHADDWTRADTYRQSSVTALFVADWAQTKYLITRNGRHEKNIFLGEHPSAGQVNAYFAASAVGHAAISAILPRDWRDGWQYVWIGIEFGATVRNHRMGIKMDF